MRRTNILTIWRCLCVLLALSCCNGFRAQPTAAQEDTRYQALTEQLRCLVCQNESLADSDAPLAKDLQTTIKLHLAQGETDQQIMQFLTQRYGEFILFKPSVSKKNILLWLGPFIILFVSFCVLALSMRIHRHKRPTKTILNAEEKTTLEQLLK